MTSVRASATLPERAVPRPRAWSLAAVLLPPATAIVIVALALLILMTPPWMHFALQLSGDSYTGAGALATPQMSLDMSDRIVDELFFGPGTFSYGGHPRFFTPDEAAHLRDVRLVLLSFLGIALVAAVGLLVATIRGRDRAAIWRAVARGGAGMALVIVVLGLFAAVAFGVAFELFHRVLFPGGNWSFPTDSALIQLYPLGFWQLTAGALGVLAIAGGLVTWWLARRRARALEARVAG